MALHGTAAGMRHDNMQQCTAWRMYVLETLESGVTDRACLYALNEGIAVQAHSE